MLINKSCRFKLEGTDQLEAFFTVSQIREFQHSGQRFDSNPTGVRWEDTEVAGSGSLAYKDNYIYHVTLLRETRFQSLFPQHKGEKFHKS